MVARAQLAREGEGALSGGEALLAASLSAMPTGASRNSRRPRASLGERDAF